MGLAFQSAQSFFSPPALQLLLAPDRIQDVVERLVVNKPMDFVLLGKAFNRIYPVLRDAPVNIAGDANIKRAGPAGQDIGPESVIAVAHGRRVSQRYG